MYKMVPKIATPTFTLKTSEVSVSGVIEVGINFTEPSMVASYVSLNPNIVFNNYDSADKTLSFNWKEGTTVGPHTFQIRVKLTDGREYYSEDLTVQNLGDMAKLTLIGLLNCKVSVNGIEYTSPTSLSFVYGSTITLVYTSLDNYAYLRVARDSNSPAYYYSNDAVTHSENLTLTSDTTLSVNAYYLDVTVPAVTISPSGSGTCTITPENNGTIPANQSATYNFTPATGYQFDYFKANGVDYEFPINPITLNPLGESAVISWTGGTTQPTYAASYTMAAYASLKTYTVYITQTANQTITVTCGGTAHTSTFTATHGQTYIVKVTPATGYNAGTPSVSSGTITGNLTVTATAATIKTYTVTINQTANQTITVKVGSVSYTQSFTVNHGTEYTASIVADTGYTAGILSSTSGTVTSNITIQATAATIKMHVVTVEKPNNGSIVAVYNNNTYTAPVVFAAMDKSTVTFTCTPNDSYKFSTFTTTTTPSRDLSINKTLTLKIINEGLSLESGKIAVSNGTDTYITNEFFTNPDEQELSVNILSVPILPADFNITFVASDPQSLYSVVPSKLTIYDSLPESVTLTLVEGQPPDPDPNPIV